MLKGMKPSVTFLAAALIWLGAVPAWSQQAAPAAAPQASPQTATPAADPVVLTVGKETVTKSEFEALYNEVTKSMQPEQRARLQGPEGKRQLAEQLAELKAMAQEARVRKIDQEPAMKSQIAMRVDQLLATTFYQQLGSGLIIDDAAVKSYYEAHKGEYEQITARHILIRFKGSAAPLREGQVDRTDEEALAKAKEVRAAIVAGGDFAELAKKDSDDTGSGVNGGTLGAFGHGSMVKPFEDAAFALKVNEVSEPIKTQFGYHIIQVEAHTSKSLDEARPEIESKIRPEMAQKAVDEIRAKADIMFDKDYFGR
jgi:parvulin-like peptidyl-prolyl isomerase